MNIASRLIRPRTIRTPIPITARQTPTFHRPQSRFLTILPTMSNTVDPRATEILEWWFSLSPQDQFSSKHDAEIKSRFGSLVESALHTSSLEDWTSTPTGTLAYIILLDQFTRNIYRVGSHDEPHLSYAGDKKAHAAAVDAISKGWDRQMQKDNVSHSHEGYMHRLFFYLPILHAESLISQIAACGLYQNIADELQIRYLEWQKEGKEESEEQKKTREVMQMGISMAVRHRDCVVEHGRFPGRNVALGRETTEVEKKYLEEHPQGW